MVTHTKYSKKNVKMGDYINQYCNHRIECVYQGINCSLQKPSKMIVGGIGNIAYIDKHYCADFRTLADGIIGADVVETGIWKQAAGIVSVA
jgi:hypothetical protein